MTTEQQVLFDRAQTGNDLLKVLDSMAADSVGFTYAESPLIAQVLGIENLEPMEF
jgi:hypothetical protein